MDKRFENKHLLSSDILSSSSNIDQDLEQDLKKFSFNDTISNDLNDDLTRNVKKEISVHIVFGISLEGLEVTYVVGFSVARLVSNL